MCRAKSPHRGEVRRGFGIPAKLVFRIRAFCVREGSHSHKYLDIPDWRGCALAATELHESAHVQQVHAVRPWKRPITDEAELGRVRKHTSIREPFDFCSVAKMSDVVIFRYYSEDSVSVKQVNVKAIYDKKNLSEDPLLKPGDTVFLSRSALGKVAPVLSRLGMGVYLNPLDLGR
jgi:hypothetical protein